jgi:transportin-1
VPGYIAYLAHIIILCPGEEETTRSVAGLILKNTLVRPVGTSGMDAAALAYVKSVILRGMADPSQTVRQTVGTVIVNLMVQTEDGGWPEGLEALMRAIDSPDENEQEVCPWESVIFRRRGLIFEILVVIRVPSILW